MDVCTVYNGELDRLMYKLRALLVLPGPGGKEEDGTNRRPC